MLNVAKIYGLRFDWPTRFGFSHWLLEDIEYRHIGFDMHRLLFNTNRGHDLN